MNEIKGHTLLAVLSKLGEAAELLHECWKLPDREAAFRELHKPLRMLEEWESGK